MYCAKCGVELSGTESHCPLCGLRAYHPDMEQKTEPGLYPRQRYPAGYRRSRWPHIIFSVLYALPMALAVFCDHQLNGQVVWSGYVVGAMALIYVTGILPKWFDRPNPIIFVPCGFAALAMFLFYVNWAVGGQWFWDFVLPVIGILAFLVTGVVTLVRSLKRGKLYIFGGAVMLLGGCMPVMELLLNRTFALRTELLWSWYPGICLVLLGGLLIFLAICRPAREAMERKLFF